MSQSIAAALGAQTDPLLQSMSAVAATEKGAVNQLEDMALTQTMFEEGKLIWLGDAEEFVNIIQNSRNSIQNMNTEDVFNYLNSHPELIPENQQQ